uniref:Uncharacterized protein n=1 Tax=Arundo donax TaxID=35708 RepID=A0A0A8YR25_ARUDO
MSSSSKTLLSCQAMMKLEGCVTYTSSWLMPLWKADLDIHVMDCPPSLDSKGKQQMHGFHPRNQHQQFVKFDIGALDVPFCDEPRLMIHDRARFILF